VEVTTINCDCNVVVAACSECSGKQFVKMGISPWVVCTGGSGT